MSKNKVVQFSDIRFDCEFRFFFLSGALKQINKYNQRNF